MKTAFCLIISSILFSFSVAGAEQIVFEDYRIHTDDIGRGVKGMVAKGFIPVGISPLNNRMIVSYVPIHVTGATGWKMDVFTSVDAFFAGLDKHIAEGFTPVDVAVSGQSILVLFLKMKIRAEGWKWIVTKIDADEVTAGIKKFVDQGYIPSGITIVSDALGVLLIKPSNCRLLSWQIGMYSSDMNSVTGDVAGEMASGFKPFGLLTGKTVTNVMMMKVDFDPPVIAKKTVPAESTQAVKKKKLPANTPALTPEVLLSAMGDFVETVRRDPEMAGHILMSAEAELIWADVIRLCGPALGYFASGAVPMVVWQDASTAMTGLYHPWTDTVLLAQWRAQDRGARIDDMEFLTGDFIRQAGQPPYDVNPHWLESDESFPPQALRESTRVTSAAFRAIFEGSHDGTWRHEVSALRNPELLTANTALASTRLSGALRSMAAFVKDAGNRPFLTELESVVSRLRDGRNQSVVSELSEISPMSREFIEKSGAPFWDRVRIMGVRYHKDRAFVFLNTPGVPWVFQALCFEKRGTQGSLTNLEIVNLPVEDAFGAGGL